MIGREMLLFCIGENTVFQHSNLTADKNIIDPIKHGCINT